MTSTPIDHDDILPPSDSTNYEVKRHDIVGGKHLKTPKRPKVIKSPTAEAAAAAFPIPPAPVAEAPPLSVVTYKTPKNMLLVIIKAGMAKSAQLPWKIFVMGFMAGMYIAIGGCFSCFVSGGAAGLADRGMGSIQKLLGAAVFPLGLILLVFAGGELYTGNVMYVGSALLGRKVHWTAGLTNLVTTYLGNLAGSLVFAYFLAYLGEVLHDDPYHKFIVNLAEKKVHAGWGVTFIRGIVCNWMVCAALFFAAGSDDFSGKISALWWPIMAFVAMGFEHSIANMFYIPLGMMEGANVSVGEFIGYNLVPVTLGNTFGGFVLVALAEWLVFSDYFGNQLNNLELNQGAKPLKKAFFSSWHLHMPHLHMPHWFAADKATTPGEVEMDSQAPVSIQVTA